MFLTFVKYKKNLLPMYKLCTKYNVSIEFSPFSFVVRDYEMGTPLVTRASKDGLYECSDKITYPLALSTQLSIMATWNCYFGHPSPLIVCYLFSFIDIPSFIISLKFYCYSCKCNKTYKQLFSVSYIKSKFLLHYIYSYIWSTSSIALVVNFSNICFSLTTILNTYGFIPWNVFFQNSKMLLKFFLIDLFYLFIPTMADNFFMIEIRPTLCHLAKLKLSFWLYAYQTIVYNINSIPTSILQFRSIFQRLFGKLPNNYSKLCVFGCVYYSWLRSYNSHKFQPQSRPCILLGYSLN